MKTSVFLLLLFGMMFAALVIPDVSHAQQTCKFQSPGMEGDWALGFGVEQDVGHIDMPNFSTIGQDIQLNPGEYNLVVNVFIWREPEFVISPTDTTHLVSFYWQMPSGADQVPLVPGERSFSEFSSISVQAFRAHITVTQTVIGRFTLFALVQPLTDGLHGVSVDYACITQEIAGGGGGSDAGCDMYLPCGPLPWQLPSLPDLASPTPRATALVAQPTWAATNSAGVPFFQTATPALDVGVLEDGMATLNAYANGTAYPITDINGTPFANDSAVATLTANSETAFGYIRGLSEISFGPLTPLVAFMFTAISLFLFVNAANFLLPLVMAIFGVFRKIISLILDFLPF